MRKALFAVLMTVLSSVALAAPADEYSTYVYLLRTDAYGNGTSTLMASFVHQPSGAGYGWSNTADPNPNYDYLVGNVEGVGSFVGGGYVELRTPYATTEINERFNGRSLTLDNGRLVMYQGGKPVTITIDDLRIKKGRLMGVNGSSGATIKGKITFDGSKYGNPAEDIEIYTWTVPFYIESDLYAAKDVKVRLTSGRHVYNNTNALGKVVTDPTMKTSQGKYYWYSLTWNYLYYLRGNNAGFNGTIYADWGACAMPDCENYNGSFYIGNCGFLAAGIQPTVERTTVKNIGGDVTLRDGWLRISNGRTVNIAGTVDAAFAEDYTHIWNGIDVYVGAGEGMPEQDSDFNSDTNFVAAVNASLPLMRNGISLEGASTLKVGKARLDKTMLWIKDAGSSVEFEELTANDARFNAAGPIKVTKKLAVIDPIQIFPSIANYKTAVLTGPRGQVKIEDFKLPAGIDLATVEMKVEQNGIYDTLYVVNYKAIDRSDKTFFLMDNDANSTTATESSFNSIGKWCQSLSPTTPATFAPARGYGYEMYKNNDGLKYLGGPMMCLNSKLSSTVFQGDYLAMRAGAYFRHDDGSPMSFTFSDLRVFDYSQTFNAGAHGNPSLTFNGKMTVYSSEAQMFKFMSQVQQQRKQNGTIVDCNYVATFTVKSKLVGSKGVAFGTDYYDNMDWAIKYHDGVNAPGPVVLNIEGNCDEYFGKIVANTNTTLHLKTGKSFPGIVKVLGNATFDFTISGGVKKFELGGLENDQGNYTFDLPADVTFSLGVNGVNDLLTVNTFNPFKIYGDANTKGGAEIYCPAKVISLYSRGALDGVLGTFPNIKELHFPYKRDNELFKGQGVYTTSGLDLDHSINVIVDIDPADVPKSKRATIALMTVPTTMVRGLEQYFNLVAPWSGAAVRLGKEVNGKMTTLQMIVEPSGFSFRYY